MKPAIFYGRVSTDQQDMERQDWMRAEYCQRCGFELLQSFADPDVSGSVPFKARTASAAVLQFINQWWTRRVADPSLPPLHIITTEQDRIGRDTLDIIGTIRTFWELGAIPDFIAEGGPVERTPENELRMELRASVAQYERNKIRQRINSRMAGKRAGGELCGTVPYGWDAEPTGAVNAKGVAQRRLVDRPAEQRWILWMLQRRAAGTGYHTIARLLNAHGVPTKRGRGEIMKRRGGAGPAERKFTTGRWNSGTVANLLQSRTVRDWLAGQSALQTPKP